MPDTPKKISELAAITTFDVNADLVPVVDVSESTLATRNKKATVKQLLDQASFLQAGTGAVTRSLQSRLQDVVSVKDFGATGNSVTDDTAAIQAAINAVGAKGGGFVFFPAGYYRVSSTLEVSSNNVFLVGESSTSSALYNASSGTAVRWASSNPATTILYGGGMRNMHLCTLPNTDSSAKGIEVIRVAYWRMQDCLVQNHLVNFEASGMTVSRISNTIFYTGYEFTTKRKPGSRCVVIKNYEANAKESTNVMFDGCTLSGQIASDGSRDPMTEYALLIDSADTVHFSNCLFQGADTIIQLRTSRANDKIASITFANCFADGNLGNNIATSNILLAFNGSATGAALADISWTGGQFSNARSDGIVINEPLATGINIAPACVSNIGRWCVNAQSWLGPLRISGAFRNFAQNAPTSADGGGVYIGAASSNSSLSIQGSISGMDYGKVVNGSPGINGALGTGLAINNYAGTYEIAGTSIVQCAVKQNIVLAPTGQTSIPIPFFPITLGSHDFESNSGSPAIGYFGGSRRNGWLLDSSTIEYVQSELYIPSYWGTQAKATIVWTNAGAGSGDVVWNITSFFGTDGINLNQPDGGSGSFTVAAPAMDIQKNSSNPTNITVTPGSMMYIKVGRVASDAADTLPNDCVFAALVLEQV